MDYHELIIRYISGTINEEEKEEFYQWIESDPGNKDLYFQEKDLWDTYHMHVSSEKLDVGKEWEKIERRIALDKRQIRSFRVNRLAWTISVAASIIILFGLGWVTHSFFKEEPSYGLMANQLVVPRGQRSMLKLADGTTVWLNSDSELNFSNFSNGSSRRVFLRGEAYFEVAKDVAHPFYVTTRNQEIKVLGTAFNVRAYESDSVTYTTLERGKVQVLANGETLFLEPGHQLVYNDYYKVMTTKEVDVTPITSWRKGRYVFENDSFDDLVEMVERWYDVEFVYPKEYFKGKHYSGVIKRIKPLEHVLSLINHITPIEYEIDGDFVRITPTKE